MLRIFVLLSALLLPFAPWASEITVSGGSEHFSWQEYNDGGSKLLKESGLRYFVELKGVNHFHPLWSSSFAGRLYSGVVGYESDYWNDPDEGTTLAPEPVSTDVDYNGMRFEVVFSRRIGELAHQRNQPQWWLDFSVGTEMWRRHLRSTRLSDGTGIGGASEDYHTVYGRMGARFADPSGFSAQLGAKWPFHTDEDARIGGDTVTLNPEGRLSVYAGVGYAFSPAWSLTLDYDSYRFAKSDPVEHNGMLVWQPESHQDALSLALHYRF